MKKKYLIAIIAIILIVLVDQTTKFLIIKNIEINSSVVLIKSFLSFTHIVNEGAAFGILSETLILLILINVGLMVYLFNELRKNESTFNIVSLGIILGGSFGNLIDRIIYGGVTDFISFQLFNYHAPIFNFADISISIGIVLLLIVTVKESIYENRNKTRK